MIIFNKKRPSYFSRILFFFFAVNILIVIISGGLYLRSSKDIVNEAFIDNNRSTISQISHLFDQLHSHIIPGLKEASYNNHNFTRLMYSDSLTDRELLDGIKEMDRLLLSYPLIDSFYIYNGQMDFFLSTSKGMESSEKFFDKDVLELVKNIDNRLMNRYWPRTTEKQLSYIESEEGPVLTLIMGNTLNNTALSGAFISNIDVEELQNILKSDSDEEFFVINEYGEWICQSNDDSLVDPETLFDDVISRGVNEGVYFNSNNKLISYSFNYRLGWYFISVMPMENINRKMFIVGQTITSILFILILFGGFLSFIATRHIYRPINSLVKFFDGENINKFSTSMMEQSPEISIIADRYRHMQSFMDEETLRSVMNGNAHYNLNEELDKNTLNILHNPLSLILIQIDDYFSIVKEKNFENFRKDREKILKIIIQMFSTENKIIIEMDDRNIVCLAEGSVVCYDELIHSLKKRISEQSLYTTTISYIERDNQQEISLNKMYNKALSAAGGKFNLGYNNIIPYKDQDRNKIIFSGELVDKLTGFLSLGNLPGAKQKLKDLVVNLKSGTYQDFIQSIRIFSYRLQHFIKDRDMDDVKRILHKIRSKPETIETINEFQIVFIDIIELILTGLSNTPSKGKDYYLLIDKYIKDSFHNPGCCVQTIAHELDLSPNYIRSIYKTYTGRSLSDDLVGLRVDEACRLLTETSAPVKDIFDKAGFTNYNSFFTSFKRIIGKTPAEYRRSGVKL